jgi:hypothetical protein
MFYAGICIEKQNQPVTMVVIEKVLVRVKKEYHIKEIIVTASGELAVLTQKFNYILESGKFDKKKRVFSQSGRPPKNIISPPVLVVGTTDENKALIQNIRDNKIKVETFFMNEMQSLDATAETSLRYGRNLQISETDLRETFNRAYNKGMISNRDQFPELFENYDKENFSEGISALAVAVYFCEKMREIKRY